MPRAKPFKQVDVKRRSKALEVDRALVERLVRGAEIAIPEKRNELTFELISAIKAYRAKGIVAKQERPAQLVAALKPGLGPARKLLHWLKSLPLSVRFELKAGGIEESLLDLEILTNALLCERNKRIKSWQTHVHRNRPTGEGAASLALRQSLTDFAARCWTGSPETASERERRAKEKKIRSWVAFACAEIGARYPNEKKNRARFTGERLPISAVKPNKLRPHRRNLRASRYVHKRSG